MSIRKTGLGVPLAARVTRVVLYARVSKDRQGGASVKRQLKRGRAHAAAMGWKVVAEYVDNDYSGSEWARRDRPQWQELMIELEAGKFDVLLVWEPSRATRDRVVYAAFMSACQEQCVKICIDGKTLDPNIADEALLLDVFFALARHGAAKTHERTTQAASQRTQAGYPGPGKVPFGYQRTYSQVTGKVEGQVLDEREYESRGTDGNLHTWTPAGIVKELFKERAAGTTAYSLAEALNARGVPNPRTHHALQTHPERERKYAARWDQAMIDTMLRNQAYLGHRCSGAKVIATNRWPALADKADYWAIRNACSQRAAKWPGPSAPRPMRSRHLMSRFALCPHCETPVQATSYEASTGERVNAYRCRSGRSYILMDEADDYVESVVITWLLEPENIDKIRRADAVASEAGEAIAEAERLESELAKWKEDAAKDRVDRDDYVAQRARLRPLIKAAQDRAATAGLPLVLRGVVLADDVAAWWTNALLPTKRDLLRALTTIVIHPKNRRRNVPIDEVVAVTFVYD